MRDQPNVLDAEKLDVSGVSFDDTSRLNALHVFGLHNSDVSPPQKE